MRKRDKTVPNGIRYSRARYHLINDTERKRKSAYSDIKENQSFADLCDSVDYLTRNVIPERQQLIYGNPLPKGYSELGYLKEFPFLGRNLVAEVNQCLIAVRKYKFEINLFLQYKERFEASLLLGDYNSAETILTKIETEICYSLWTLENRFVLLELSGRAFENKELLSKFNEENTSKGFTKHLAHYLSLRAEHSLSVSKYNRDLELSINRLKETSTSEACKSFYRFKLTFLNHIDFDNYGEIMSLDFANSVIDRYLNLTKVLTNLFVVSNYLSKDDKEREATKIYLKNRVNYLLRKVKDPVLFKLKLFASDSLFPAFDQKSSELEIKIIDNYTSGLYDLAEADLKQLLLTYPAQFDLYILYTKSLIFQKKKFQEIGNKKSLQNEILSNVFQITAVNSNPDQATLNLLRIANNICSSTLSYGITDFVYFQTKGKRERNLLSRLSYSAANPIIHEIFQTQQEKEQYLNLLSSRFPNSITIEFFQEKLKGFDYLAKYEEKIPTGKYKLELAKKLQDVGNYEQAAMEWEFLIENYRDTVPIFEASVMNLFHCYLRLGRIDECLAVFVDNYFINNHIIDKIETDELLAVIRTSKFRTVQKNINLPIFYTIVDADPIETHIAYELFNRECGVEYPTELLTSISNFDRSKFLYFLEYTCSSKVLMHSTFIDSSKDRLEERLSIINFIREVNPLNKNVPAEIKNIENILVIQQGLIDLDESKIYVNEQGIIENELQEFQAIYDRFEVIAGITSGNKRIFWLEGGKLATYESEENAKIEKIEYSNNPVYDIYVELFNAVKDKFLNSQFGIVAYLSTRIRHGVLVGEIRPIFETHKLITLRDGKTSEYRRNYHWDAVYSESSPEKLDMLQLILSDFAGKVDGLIFDLIKKHLQVYKLEVNDDGWFNYEFDENHLWYHSIAAIKSENFEDFVRGIFAVLWTKTDENLSYIRERIQGEILSQFNEFFEELERNITSLLGRYRGTEIIKAIKDCSTETQTVINKISRWFKRSEIRAADFHISEVVNIIEEYTNKSSWHKRLILEKSIESDLKIKGVYKTHFADLIRIFLENIIKHSDEGVNELAGKISCYSASDDVFVVVIENDIYAPDTIETLRTIWKANSQDKNKLISEGKSGYHKAYKILTSDLKCSKSECLSTAVVDNEQRFAVTMKINIKDLKV
jgi:hypothetical protein